MQEVSCTLVERETEAQAVSSPAGSKAHRCRAELDWALSSARGLELPSKGEPVPQRVKLYQLQVPQMVGKGRIT